jgi:hypothetical protein
MLKLKNSILEWEEIQDYGIINPCNSTHLSRFFENSERRQVGILMIISYSYLQEDHLIRAIGDQK